ncbi:hypothetical protein Q5O24_08585 [Eubacteriaceae bacterium ES3]|nr:hypothetical protein Q5O24_08585 [Eubacteriaceae bacterium ES3]
MKKKKILLMLVLVLILAFSFAGPTFAADTQVVVNFDDLTGLDPVPADYAGLIWEPGWTVYPDFGENMRPYSAPYSGYFYSPSQSSTSIDFSSLGTDVTFEGAWFSGIANTGIIHFEGWRDGAVVASSGNLIFDMTNFRTPRYLAADFGEPVDKVVIYCLISPTSYNVFAMDDFTYTIPDTTIAVDFNVSSDINIGSKGVLPLTILGSEDFDVSQIAPETILIGSTGISEKGNKLQFSLDDINADGYLDGVFKVSIPDLVLNGDLNEFTSSLTISGAFYDGSVFEGIDTVNIVP